MSNLEKFILMSTGIKSEMLAEVSISPMTNFVRDVAECIVKPKQCYDNSFKLLQRLIQTTTEDVKYVLGMCVCSSILPIEHAWIKVGAKYYDPTLEIVVGDIIANTYYSVMEFDLDEAITAMESVLERSDGDYCPPMFNRMVHSPIYKHLYMSQQERKAMFIGNSISLEL
ncbi:hypothetical protein GLP21_12070 [Photobacterium carnosum]|uniref:Uncharacterized protein n=2 Tax=Photobacterium carnosum TaxID=2023717 RepID=A0A2N4UW28_9GAMM|nr:MULTISPECIES: hypothetical protein [Photobacterium]MCD9485852.1 hypothetical protein [Photobacterium iliopiscarium]MCD9543207.1 hypothetical protein [Photobacterium carnosum]MCD9547000.1 hypothetical protein [Photobacterium carnosum]MCD9549364.1 hypothetical protein [Photobacterium carnosum]MCD9553097.1 hypothetical protein [Photobacterium carnosum]